MAVGHRHLREPQCTFSLGLPRLGYKAAGSPPDGMSPHELLACVSMCSAVLCQGCSLLSLHIILGPWASHVLNPPVIPSFLRYQDELNNSHSQTCTGHLNCGMVSTLFNNTVLNTSLPLNTDLRPL